MSEFLRWLAVAPAILGAIATILFFALLVGYLAWELGRINRRRDHGRDRQYQPDRNMSPHLGSDWRWPR